MSWELASHSTPKARKEYSCQALPFIPSDICTDYGLDDEDIALIEKARTEDFKIKKGDKYVKITGKWEGEFSTFRARSDLNAICIKYDLYME